MDQSEELRLQVVLTNLGSYPMAGSVDVMLQEIPRFASAHVVPMETTETYIGTTK